MRTTSERRAAMRAASQECLDAMVGRTLDDLPSNAHRAVVGASQAIVDLLDDLDEVIADLDAEARLLAAESAQVGELAAMVEATDARRYELAAQNRALVAKLDRVRSLHSRGETQVLAPACAAEECNCVVECPTVPMSVCTHCLSIGEEASPYAYECGGMESVSWPCPTITILDADGGES